MSVSLVRKPASPGRQPAALHPKPAFRADREFLPAALAIVETPPSPVHTALLGSICLLVAAAFVWSYVGQIDIVSVSPGKVQPEGRVKTIQSVDTGRVKRITVTNGMAVKAGDVLFTLDPADARAEGAELTHATTAFRAEALRRRFAAASARAAHLPNLAWPAEIPPDTRRAQEAVLTSELDQLHADVTNLEADLAKKRAEEHRLDLTIAAQAGLVATLKQRVDMRTALLTSGAGPKAAVLDAEENYQTQAANLAYQTGQKGESEAAVASASTAIQKAYAAFIADNTEKATEAERQADDDALKLAEANVRQAQLTVTAPIDGVVQGSTITTDGQVVTTGEELMRIVPSGSDLEVRRTCPIRMSASSGRVRMS